MHSDLSAPRLQVSAGGVVYRTMVEGELPTEPETGALPIPVQTSAGPRHEPPSHRGHGQHNAHHGRSYSSSRSLHSSRHGRPGQGWNAAESEAFVLEPGFGPRLEVALIRVGRYNRWQLPKGTVEKDESREDAALREVREETGLTAEIVEPIETIEYWYRCMEEGRWIHFHKFVSFYLMRFIHGSVLDHDHEVTEARWVEIGTAIRMLAFDNERRLVAAARQRLR